MELATSIQILSLGILGAAATALMADFLKARRQLTSAMVTWQEGAKAQRGLNYISEQLWELQQRGHGAFSLLVSWGGVGTGQRPLADAIASAVHRMNHMNRNRTTISKESVNYHRKVV